MTGNMEIIEQFLQGKRPDDSLCEDRLVITPDFVAVIDGVTSKTPLLFQGLAPGRLAAVTLEQVIRSWEAEISLEEAIESMTTAIRQIYEELDILEPARKDATQRLSASVILYSRSRREIWSIGDCQCMISGVWHQYPKKADAVVETARALYIETELLSGRTEAELLAQDTAREFVLPLIKKAVGFQNSESDSPYAYGLIDGFPVNWTSVHIEHVEIGTTIVLASDGYPKLCESLKESEEYLNMVMKTDPLCYRIYISTKGLTAGNRSYDDRSYIRFLV